MKNSTNLLFALMLGLAVVSCSESKKEQPAEETSATGSEMMVEEPAYDATKIDPNAPVTEILLKAQGNTMADMKYDQKELRVKAGSTVKLQLKNEGTDLAMVHNFVLIEEGTAEQVGPEAVKAGPDKQFVPAMKQVLVSSKQAQPQETVEITFPAPPKGTYDFICTYPGHYQIMNGKFIVE